MGTNFLDFLKEAHRVLKPGYLFLLVLFIVEMEFIFVLFLCLFFLFLGRGILKIAEVVSRFESINAFIKALNELGFRLTSKDASNKMFVLLDFEKRSSSGNTAASEPTYIQGMGPRPPKPHYAKSSSSSSSSAAPLLKPCVYKKR